MALIPGEEEVGKNKPKAVRNPVIYI